MQNIAYDYEPIVKPHLLIQEQYERRNILYVDDVFLKYAQRIVGNLGYVFAKGWVMKIFAFRQGIVKGIVLTMTTVTGITTNINSALAQAPSDAKACQSIYSQTSNIQIEGDSLFKTFEATHSISQIIRDNHRDYSNYVATEYIPFLKSKNENTSLLEYLVQFKGPVPGDNHAGQRIIGPDLTASTLEYFNWDLKEGSVHSPYFYSLANLVLNTHAVVKKNEVKIKDVAARILYAYIQGLEKSPFPEPATIADAKKFSIKQFNEMLADDLSRFIKKKSHMLKIKEGKLDAFGEQDAELGITRAQLAEAIELYANQTNETVKMLDVAIRPKERGSAHLRRIWVLIERTNREETDPLKLDIIEFKQNLPSTMEALFPSNLNQEQAYEMLRKTFGSKNKSNTQLVRLNGHYMEMRRRKVDLMAVPYSQSSIEQAEDALQLASYAAYDQGRRQSEIVPAQQTQSLKTFLLKSDKQVVEEIRKLVKAYYVHIKSLHSEYIEEVLPQSQIDSEGSREEIKTTTK